MARTYRDIAIEEMVRTIEEAMSRVIDYWGDLPAPMKDSIEQFRIQLGAAIDSVDFVKRALDRQVPKLITGKARPDVSIADRWTYVRASSAGAQATEAPHAVLRHRQFEPHSESKPARLKSAFTDHLAQPLDPGVNLAGAILDDAGAQADVPDGVLISAGMTCTVILEEGATPQFGLGLKSGRQSSGQAIV